MREISGGMGLSEEYLWRLAHSEGDLWKYGA